MTFYHFGNCLALAGVPYYLAYKYSGLSEYGAFWKCVQTGFIFTFTQLAKMLVLATFFPVPGGNQDAPHLPEIQHFRSPLTLEFFKTTIDLADLVGMYIALSRIPGRGHPKILTCGIGWGCAELILTRFLVLWVGAKGIEFNWRYIQQSLDANICLIQHLATAALVWLWSRHDVKPIYYPVIVILALISSYKTFLIDILLLYAHIDPWSGLLIKALATGFLGILTMRVYSTVA